MRKLMKALGFLSILATVSDVSGMAGFYLKPNRDIGINEVVSDDVVSEDFRLSSPKKPRRSRRAQAVEEKPQAENLPQPSVPPNSTLFTDIVANRELFVRFDFGGYERDTLCAVNREMGKDSVGLLLLEPSGILNSLLIDRNTLTVIHKKASIPRKELRNDLASRGVLVPDARLIASQVAEVRESKSTATAQIKESERRTLTKTSRKSDALLTKMREGLPKKDKLSPAQSREALEHFRKEIQESGNGAKQEAVIEK